MLFLKLLFLCTVIFTTNFQISLQETFPDQASADFCDPTFPTFECYQKLYQNETGRLKRQTSNFFSLDFKTGCGAQCGGSGEVFDFGSVSQSMVNSAVFNGMKFVSNVAKVKKKMPVLTQQRSAEFAHAQFLQQSAGVPSVEEIAFVAMDAAKTLTGTLGINRSKLNQMKFRGAKINGTMIEKSCPRVPSCDPNSKYRTIDGSCNNLYNPKLGMAFTPLKRLVVNNYDDGFSLPRKRSVTGRRLLNPRTVSNLCAANYSHSDPDFTTMLVAFGQFLDHDLDHVPVVRNDGQEPINCCENSDSSFEAEMMCFPIFLPVDDPVFKRSRKCINFVRSVAAPGLFCQPGPMNQINQLTHWMDSSNVYGSSKEVSDSLRTFRDGLLKTSACADGTECLPFAERAECRGPTRRCALAGDLRVNEQPTLGVMHLLFVREHNRLARGLKIINPHYRDEQLFQEARRILNAEFQHIAYNEFLPTILGERQTLLPLKKGLRVSYDDRLDSRISNAFAAAGFRIGHTYINKVYQLYSIATNKLTQEMDLQNIFGNADLIREVNIFEQLLKGLTIQPAENPDNSYADAIKHALFVDSELGLDLIALNIQRGRDHGLPGYNQYRKFCNLPVAKDFVDLANNIPLEKVLLLSQSYHHVDDIDLFVGMSMEDPCPGAFVGCTFACIISDVFERLRVADRFFYDLAGYPGSFTLEQVDEIRKVTLARIICDNSNIKSTTRFAIRQPNLASNPIGDCDTFIPKLDLDKFTESASDPIDVRSALELSDPGNYVQSKFRQSDYEFD